MKRLKMFMLILALSMVAQNVQAQFLKKLTKHAEKKIEQEAEKRANKRVDNKIDEEFDKIEDGIDGKNTTSDDINERNSKDKTSPSNRGVSDEDVQRKNQKQSAHKNNPSIPEQQPKLVWNRFDFVPGDAIFFEDGPSLDEESGEFPSRWDLHKGTTEVGELDGEMVIVFGKSGSIIPYLEDSNKDYLPEIFTIEMDVFFPKGNDQNRYWVSLIDRKNQRNSTPLI